jgi:hypothetical protein
MSSNGRPVPTSNPSDASAHSAPQIPDPLPVVHSPTPQQIPSPTSAPSPRSAPVEIDGKGNGQATANRSTGHITIPRHLAHRPHLSEHRTESHRSLSEALRQQRSREEQETLLGDDEIADPDGCLREDGGIGGPRAIFCPDPHAGLGVYVTIHRWVR